MGKIFKISDNPVSTITSCFEPLKIEKPVEKVITPALKTRINVNNCDKFESSKIEKKSNPFVRMRNGIGRLMSHFQHPNKTA